jgi:hypothetical protein
MIGPNEYYQVLAASVINNEVPFSKPMLALRVQNDNDEDMSMFITVASLVATNEAIEVKAGKLFAVTLPHPTQGIGIITDPDTGVVTALSETPLAGGDGDLALVRVAAWG